MKGLIRALCLVSAMMLFVSSVSQSFALKWSFSESTHGNIVERTSGGVTTTFDYDLVGQLIEESRTGYLATYSYDANGNRLTRTVNSVTEEYAYDSADKLLSVSIDELNVKQFGYDAAGRTTSVTTSAGTTTLSWDYEDRLTGITYPSTATNSFSYNAFGARVSKTDSSGTSNYARNGVGVTSPVLSDGSLTFTPGISSNDGSDSTWSHGDIKNSLRQTGENESTTSTKQYDAFGNEMSSTGTWSGPFQYGGPFGYQTDSDSGLKLLGHRYYDSSTGRFLSKDTAKDGSNWFTYCYGNPLSRSDPTGNIAPILVYGAVLLIAAIGGGAYEAANAPPGKRLESFGRGALMGLIAGVLAIALVEAFPVVIAAGGGLLARNPSAVSNATRGGTDPVFKGQTGVQRSIEAATARGEGLRGTEISIRTANGMKGRLDFVTEKGNTLIPHESKNGITARLSPNQRALFQQLEEVGGHVLWRQCKEVGSGWNYDRSNTTMGRLVAVSVSRARGTFIKSVDAILRSHALRHGLKKSREIYWITIGDQMKGWIGFGRATHRSAEVFVGPAVGITHDYVTQLLAELHPQKPPMSASLLTISLGYLMPSSTYKEWVFSETADNEAVASDLLNAYLEFGFRWQWEHATLEAISGAYDSNDIATPVNSSFTKPAVWYLLGDVNRAKAYVQEELEKLVGEEHVLAEAYIPFGKAFLEMIDNPSGV